MIAQINQILSGFNSAPGNPEPGRHLKLGDSFVNNAIIKRMLSAIISPGYHERRQIKNPGMMITSPPLSRYSEFCLLILILNRHFDLRTNRILDGFEEQVKAMSQHLHVSTSDYESLLTFYQTNKPYADAVNSAYLAPENASRLVLSKGVHVYFNNHVSNEIVYLKYFKSYKIFLSKSFKKVHSYNSITEEISIGEINILGKVKYAQMNYRLPAFKILKASILNFNPLQHIIMAETPYNPQITLDPANCILSVSGSSSPISDTTFFEPVLEWLNIFNAHKTDPLHVQLKFKYFNTYTAKFLINLVWACNRISNAGKIVSFYWYCDAGDEEMKEFGEHLKAQSVEKKKFYILENKELI